jgi:hypothetical protein
LAALINSQTHAIDMADVVKRLDSLEAKIMVHQEDEWMNLMGNAA